MQLCRRERSSRHTARAHANSLASAGDPCRSHVCIAMLVTGAGRRDRLAESNDTLPVSGTCRLAGRSSPRHRDIRRRMRGRSRPDHEVRAPALPRMTTANQRRRVARRATALSARRQCRDSQERSTWVATARKRRPALHSARRATAPGAGELTGALRDPARLQLPRELPVRGRRTATQETSALLGPDRQQKFDAIPARAWRARRRSSQLRASLPDSGFLQRATQPRTSSSRSTKSARSSKEAQQRGTGFNGYGTGSGMLFVADHGALTDQRRRASDAVQPVGCAQRAATVLTPEQLASFNQMQDELLASLRRDAAVRPATAASRSN